MAAKRVRRRDRNRNPGWSMALVGKAPLRRMSDTLIELARPELLHEGDCASEWQPKLLFAAMVWNGVVAGKSSSEITAQLRHGIEVDHELESLVETLVRKRSQFVHDRRFVMGADGIHVIAQSGR